MKDEVDECDFTLRRKQITLGLVRTFRLNGNVCANCCVMITTNNTDAYNG